MRFSSKELLLLARLISKEGNNRAEEDKLRGHICPTFLHYPHGSPDTIDCLDVAKRLKQLAEEQGQNGPYR